MLELGEVELKVFVDAVLKYFALTTKEEATIRSVYLGKNTPPCHPYIGLITVSGKFRGCVHFSTSAQMIRELLACWGERDTSQANLLDAVGEVANTIAGNARRHFGKDLEISVPITLYGASEQIKTAVRTHPLVIALNWRSHEVLVVVDLASAE